MTNASLATQPSFFKKTVFGRVTIAAALVAAIMLLALGLHLYNIQSIGDANAYYTAAVQSMLKSWSNFFFVAAEPGGSVSVDKPPLGLWIEAVFAYFLGVSGLSVSLPNIIAGVLGIPLLYELVKKYAGELAGLIAALVMALTPVYIATNRNNTMDGMLVFVLLLAAWAFIQATESGKLRWLMLAAFVIGLGFNIKMLQAFLPLPAFYALYFFGSREAWLRKALKLAAATALLLAVSFSWAVAVDLTPASQRPYIGSSGNNTMMGLIFGHNGLSRLEGHSRQGPGNGGTPPSGPQAGAPSQNGSQPQQGPRQGPPQAALDACASSSAGAACSFTLPNANSISGSCVTPPNTSQLACAPQGMLPQLGQGPLGQNLAQGPGGSGTQFSQETGNPGLFRFFTSPLSKQMSWLLPFALISLLFTFFAARIRVPIESNVHKALLLWGGWLLTCVVLFSAVSGIFHAYYAIMLAPPLGAMMGIGVSLLWSWGRDKNWAGILLIAASAVTIGFQIFAWIQYGESFVWMIFAALLFIAGAILMFVSTRAAYATLLVAMLLAPTYWTVMTTASNANMNLPSAYQGTTRQRGPDGLNRPRQPGDGGGTSVDQDLLAYLQENTQNMKYLVAVPSAQVGAPIVLASDRPVLYMGGFAGQDDVVSAQDLSAIVTDGQLRYVLYGGDRGSKQEISNWLQSSCFVIKQFSAVNAGGPLAPPPGPAQQDSAGPRNQTLALYQCQ